MKMSRWIFFVAGFVMLLCASHVNSAEKQSWLDKLTSMLPGSGKHQVSIKEIVQETKKIKDNVRDVSERHVLQSIKEHDELVAAIHKDVNSRSWLFFKKSDDEKYEIIFEGVHRMRDFYKELQEDNNGKEVRREMASYTEKVKYFADGIDGLVKQEMKAQDELQVELASLNPEIGAQELQVRRNSLIHRIRLNEERIRMLQKFAVNYQRVPPLMQQTEATMGRFFLITEEGAKVYDDAFKTLKLSKNMNIAFRTLEEMKYLDSISQELTLSCQELKKIVNTMMRQGEGLPDPTN